MFGSNPLNSQENNGSILSVDEVKTIKPDEILTPSSIITSEEKSSAIPEAKKLVEQSIISSTTSGSDLPNSFVVSNKGKIFKENKSDLTEEKEEGLDSLKGRFGELGALVIRFHIGQGQRVGLLQQIARDDYATNPVEKPAIGKNQENLFAIDPRASFTRTTTRSLEKYCHYSLGRGKVLNERAQPLVHTNSTELRGEQKLWDIIHSGVWGTGINLEHQLHKQGFLYVVHPKDMTPEEYTSVSKELKEGAFEIITEDAATVIKTTSGKTLNTYNINKLKIDVDSKKTHQKNGVVVTVDKQSAPLGWIIHTKLNKVVEADQTDHLARVIRIAKGGFYELTKEQQELMQAGLLKNNGFGLFTQNQAFNAMQTIFASLEKEFKFDASPLLTQKALDTSYSRVKEMMKDTEIVEDFLTGALITEMVQPLRITQPHSTRTELPRRFTNPYKVTSNNAKAIAFTYDMVTKDGKPILELDQDKPTHSPDPELIDYRVNGDLIDPKLTNPKHIASLLATGILVAEQVIIEQLLRDACKHGDSHPNAVALRKILETCSPTKGLIVYKQLIEMAQKVPQNEQGPILGLQFSYCDPIVAKLRTTLAIASQPTTTQFIKSKCCSRSSDLATVAKDLYDADEKKAAQIIQRIAKDDKVEQGLTNLYFIGETLQELQGISAKDHDSRGINAGIIPVIKKLSSSLTDQPGLKTTATKSTISTESKTDSVTLQAEVESSALQESHKFRGTRQPYMGRQKMPTSSTWSNFFGQRAVSTLEYMYNTGKQWMSKTKSS
jgi:hypothetical protein